MIRNGHPVVAGTRSTPASIYVRSVGVKHIATRIFFANLKKTFYAFRVSGTVAGTTVANITMFSSVDAEYCAKEKLSSRKRSCQLGPGEVK